MEQRKLVVALFVVLAGTRLRWFSLQAAHGSPPRQISTQDSRQVAVEESSPTSCVRGISHDDGWMVVDAYRMIIHS